MTTDICELPWYQEDLSLPSVLALVGTHSSGKTTDIKRIEQGKLIDDLEIGCTEYPDLGYAWLAVGQESKLVVPVVTVPETARWLSEEVYNNPRLVTDEYTLRFQFNEVLPNEVLRIAKARILAQYLLTLEAPLRDDQRRSDRPVVFADRTFLDDLVYAACRYPDVDTDSVAGHLITGPTVNLLRGLIDVVIIADHTKVPFELDGSRVENDGFREQIAAQVTDAYTRLKDPKQQLYRLEGTTEERHTAIKAIIHEVVLSPPDSTRTPVTTDSNVQPTIRNPKPVGLEPLKELDDLLQPLRQ